jgi:hypothetical protein
VNLLGQLIALPDRLVIERSGKLAPPSLAMSNPAKSRTAWRPAALRLPVEK